MGLAKQHYSFFIFDWDGTLIDSTARIVEAMQATAGILNLVIPTEEAVKSIIGLSMAGVMDTLFSEITLIQKDKFLTNYRYQYAEGVSAETPVFNGAKDLMSFLKSRSAVTAIATGKARAGLNRAFLESVFNDDDFDHSICADEAQSKPHPEMIFELIKRAGKSKEETLVIGDSLFDINMANNAGVDAIAVTSGAGCHQSLNKAKPLDILAGVSSLQSWLQS